MTLSSLTIHKAQDKQTKQNLLALLHEIIVITQKIGDKSTYTQFDKKDLPTLFFWHRLKERVNHAKRTRRCLPKA